LAVVLRGIRYRPGRSLVVVALAAISIGALVLAPAYSRAAQQSVLSDRLAAAPPNATALHLVAAPLDSSAAAAAATDTTASKVAFGALLQARPTLHALLGTPIGGADVDVVLNNDRAVGRLAYRDASCAHLTFTAGRCPADPGAVAISARSAAQLKLTIGSSVSAHVGTGAARSLVVAGVYEPRNPSEPYWGRGGYFAAGDVDQETALPRVDALFVGTEDDLGLPRAVPTVRLDYDLDTSGVDLDAVPGLRSDLASFTTAVNAAEFQLSTALPEVLDDIDTEVSALGRIVPVVAVPLVLICWFVLFLVVAAVAEERAPEVALAQLRGYPPSRAGRFGRAETLTLIVIAIPLGLAAGLGLVQYAAATMLAPGGGGTVRVEARWPVAAAALLAAVGAYVAVRVGSRRAFARPVLSLLRRVPQRMTWRSGALEGSLVALAAACIVVAVRDQTAPLALLTPAAIALVGGVASARLLALWSRARLRRHTRRGRVTGVLAHAQISRRPQGQRVVLVVTVAVGLLAFAATAWDVADQARRDAATDTVGADRVLRVGASDPAALVAAVKQAAPDGHALAAVRATEPYGTGTVELIGVQSGTFADVAAWRDHDRAATGIVAGLLRGDTVPTLTITGAVDIAANVSAVSGTPSLAVVVAPPGTGTRTVSAGALSDKRHAYRAEVTGCAAGCRLVGLAVVPDKPGEIAATIAITGLSSGGHPLDAGFVSGQRWAADLTRAPTADVRVTPGDALGVQVRSVESGPVVIAYRDGPEVLPVVVAGGSPADDPAADDFSFPALGETPQRFHVVQRATRLPRVGERALMFDLDDAVRAAQRTSALSDSSRLRYEVWAGPDAPADLSARLAGAGLSIIGEESIAAERGRLERNAPALGLRLSLLAGVAALLLAVGAVLLTAYVGAAPRRTELAALRVAGVRPGQLRRGLLREYLHLALVPLVVGGIAGAAAAVLMLPGIPLVRVGAPAGPISYVPGMGAVPLGIVATVVGLLVAVLAVLGLVRRATPDRLREGI
jgi:predicted lysophospholipase L1 biosynthesis ABC-type transport system permease subunit